MAERRGRWKRAVAALRGARSAAAAGEPGPQERQQDDESESAEPNGGDRGGGAAMPARPSLGDLNEAEERSSARSRLLARHPRLGSLRRAHSGTSGLDAEPESEREQAGSSGVVAPAEPGRGQDPDPIDPHATPSRAAVAFGGAGAFAGTVATVLWRLIRDGAVRLSDAWFTLSLLTRQRIAAAASLLALILIVVFVLVPVAPCWAPGGGQCAPDDDALALVAADADGYVHLSLDPETEQAQAAADIGARLPDLSTRASGLLAAATGRVIDYERDIAPWSGGELALVLEAGFTGVENVVLIEVDDEQGADAFAETYLGAGVETSDRDGITISADRDGNAVAAVAGFLVLGPEQAVGEEVELARGNGETLDSNPDYERALAALPADRLASAWLSADFSRALFADTGAAASFDTFVNAAAGEGVAAALSVADDTIGLSVESLQDPQAPDSDDDFFAALDPFEPTLADSISADALAYVGLGNPALSARTLLDRAAQTAPELFKGLKRFNRNLENKDDVDLEQSVLPVLDGEAALTVEPQLPPGQSSPTATPGTLAPTSAPYLALLATGVDVDAALADLAELQGPIADNVDPAKGQAPVFETTEVDGLEAHSLRISPVVDLTYAGYDSRLIVGTSPVAVERARSDQDRLADSQGYEQAIDGLPDSLSMLVYLNAKGLLALGERLFLAEDPSYVQIAADLRTLNGVALGVRSDAEQLSTELRVTVGEPEPAETAPPPLPPTGG